MNLVTVFKAFSQAEAEVTRSRLEAVGFHATVIGELAGISMEGYAKPNSGIRVQVLENEAAEAREFLTSGTESTE